MRMGPAQGRRDLIKPATREWVAAKEPPDGQSEAAQRAVPADGYRCVLRTRRDITASARSQRMNRGRQPALVEGKRGEQDARHNWLRVAATAAPCNIRADSLLA
jgi:hypothetical protein